MEKISYFNVVGPIMIGPSSSHTAGACRIGLAARAILEKDFKNITFKLYGSFAKTYIGHGTDRALIAGCLGLMPDDERLIDAFNLADEKGIDIKFEEVELPLAHPNTAIVEFTYEDGSVRSIEGISTGGGQIEVRKIDGQSVKILPGDPTLILQYEDRKGVIAKVTSVLAENDFNIEKIMNNHEGNIITLVIILDKKIDDNVYEKIKNSGEYNHVSYVYF